MMNFFKSTYLIIAFWLAGALSPAAAQQSRTVTLAGYNSVPKVQTAATGSVTVTLKNDSLIVTGSFTDLSNYYYGAAIYYGKKGRRGNQLIDLKATINKDHTSGTFKAADNTFALNEEKREALSQGRLYISILSYDNPNGELRAQIPPIK